MTMQVQESLHYQGACRHPADNNRFVESVDPATSRVAGRASLGPAHLADDTAEAARSAFEESQWQAKPRLRAGILLEFASRLEEQKEWLSDLLVRENGRVMAKAVHEILAGCSKMEYYAGLAPNVFRRMTETGQGSISFLAREAADFAVAVVPFNARVTLLVRSVAASELVAGRSRVVKPAHRAPLVNAEAIRCLDEIKSLPAGLVNSVKENGVEAADALAAQPGIDPISLTGSSSTGRGATGKAAAATKRVSLDPGVKSPAIVFEDAGIDIAVSEIYRAAIALTRQMCRAVSRVLLQEAAARDFGLRLKSAFESVKIGNGLPPGVETDAFKDEPNQERVLGIVERAGDEAELPLRGTAPGRDRSAGAFIVPTIFRTDDTEPPLVQEELFGPIVSPEIYPGKAEAINSADATRYGLAASVYARDFGRATRLSRKLTFGTVSIIRRNRLFAEAETGGYRESGMGRLHGIEGLNDCLETRHIYIEAGSS